MAQDSPDPNSPDRSPPTWSRTMEYLVPIALLGIWIVLQIWVLPKAGMSS